MPIHRKAARSLSRAIAALVVLALAWVPTEAEARGTTQEEPQEQIEALSRRWMCYPPPS